MARNPGLEESANRSFLFGIHTLFPLFKIDSSRWQTSRSRSATAIVGPDCKKLPGTRRAGCNRNRRSTIGLSRVGGAEKQEKCAQKPQEVSADFFVFDLGPVVIAISLPFRYPPITEVGVAFCGWVDNTFIGEVSVTYVPFGPSRACCPRAASLRIRDSAEPPARGSQRKPRSDRGQHNVTVVDSKRATSK